MKSSPFHRAIRSLLFACLAQGFAACLSASEPSLSPAPVPAAAPAPRPDRQFAESDLLALLTSTLQQESVHDRGELELRLTQPWKPRTVPAGPLTIKVLEMPTQGVTPSFIVRFELRTDQASLGTWQLPVQARVWREVWVARSPVQRGTLTCDADLASERRDVLTVHEPLADLTPGDTTVELAESLQSGFLVLARSVKLRAVVHRGQTADAVVQDGPLNITMKVEVLEDGTPGQTVRARNLHTRRDLRGKVLNAQTILVSM